MLLITSACLIICVAKPDTGFGLVKKTYMGKNNLFFFLYLACLFTIENLLN